MIEKFLIAPEQGVDVEVYRRHSSHYSKFTSPRRHFAARCSHSRSIYDEPKWLKEEPAPNTYSPATRTVIKTVATLSAAAAATVHAAKISVVMLLMFVAIVALPLTVIYFTVILF